MSDDNDSKAAEARSEARTTHRRAWLFMWALTPPTIAAYFLLSFETFVRITSLGTALMSIYAITATLDAKAKAAEAKAAGYENPS